MSSSISRCAPGFNCRHRKVVRSLDGFMKQGYISLTHIGHFPIVQPSSKQFAIQLQNQRPAVGGFLPVCKPFFGKEGVMKGSRIWILAVCLLLAPAYGFAQGVPGVTDTEVTI